MRESVKHWAELAAGALELFGIAVIMLAILIATTSMVAQSLRGKGHEAYEGYRRKLGQGILLGLEILVGADIIQTVAVEFTLHSVGVLALVVLVRTFLSFTMEVEISGRWPWQQGPSK